METFTKDEVKKVLKSWATMVSSEGKKAASKQKDIALQYAAKVGTYEAYLNSLQHAYLKTKDGKLIQII